MNWFLCFSISAFLLTCANAWRNIFESEGHDSSQQSILTLRQNLVHPKITASSNNGDHRLDVLERELQKLKEENNIFRDYLLNLEDTIKQFQKHNFFVPPITDESANGTMTNAREGRDEGQITKSIDGILSSSPGSSMNVEGLDVKRQNDRGPVAFFAQLSDSLTSLGMNQIIHFNNVVTNIGGGYHPFLGVFIAPVKGLYVFHVRAMVAAGHRQYVKIYKDGSLTEPLYPDASDAKHYVTDSVTVVLELNKGSSVSLRAGPGTGYLHGNQYSVFSGWLLSPL